MSDDKPIAAAALQVGGEIASMAVAGTLPEFRGRGAHKQLLWQRLKEAWELGCNYNF